MSKTIHKLYKNHIKNEKNHTKIIQKRVKITNYLNLKQAIKRRFNDGSEIFRFARFGGKENANHVPLVDCNFEQ